MHQPGLPRQGLINHPEGLAAVRALEELIADPAFRAEASAWRRGPAIILTALYDSQVRLLRLLVNEVLPDGYEKVITVLGDALTAP